MRWLFALIVLASIGEGRWHPPEGAYAYGEFELLEVAYNVRRPD